MTETFTKSACASVPHSAPESLHPQNLSSLRGAHQRSPAPRTQNMGRKRNRATSGVRTAMRKDDSSGRIKVHARPERDDDEDWRSASAGMSAAITRPITSSMMAALVRTVPILVCCNANGVEDAVERLWPGLENARADWLFVSPCGLLAAEATSITSIRACRLRHRAKLEYTC